jgi:hypothetical protein
MEFSLICPNDGSVDLGLEDISSIVFNGFESMEVVFVCPVCGTEIRVSAQMPNVLITMLDLADVLEQSAEAAAEITFEVDEDGELLPYMPDSAEVDEDRIERYCEYFKRQLTGVDTVEAFLAEVDAR